MTAFEEARDTDMGGAFLSVSPTGWFYLHLQQGTSYDLEPSCGVREWLIHEGVKLERVTASVYMLKMNQGQLFAAKMRWG